MAAATITERLETNDPTVEDVILTATDGETYTSKKFATVKAVHATLNEDTGGLSIPLSCAISGNEVTIHATGLSDNLVFLSLKGRK